MITYKPPGVEHHRAIAIKHRIREDGCLVLRVDSRDQRELRRIRDEKDDEYGPWGSVALEAEAMEQLVCNSELDWVNPSDITGNMTEAPTQLDCIEEMPAGSKFPTNFGLHWVGHWNTLGRYQPILARWRYMNYAVRSFLDDLADTGESVWQGGYA